MPIPKPNWPYRDETTLTAAPNGQWCKKHKGKTYYFGVWSDPKAALEQWRVEWPLIVRGQTIKLKAPSTCDLKPALEAFLNARRADHGRGELAWSSYREYKDVCALLLRALGQDREVGRLGPADFDRVMQEISHRSPISRGNFVVKTRSIFAWIARHYGVTVDFGTGFKGPPRKSIRQQLNRREDKTLTPMQIKAMLDVASPTMQALIYLGINGGYGNSDVASLPARAIDFKGKVIDYYRAKTEARRIVPLWPETIKAIKAVMVDGQELLFADEKGRPLVRRGSNDICRMMEQVRVAAGFNATYYGFRYTFATVAAETGDDHARHLIMGHIIDGVSENYVLRFPHDRLVKVSNHVRDWYLKGVRQGESRKRGKSGGAAAGKQQGDDSEAG